MVPYPSPPNSLSRGVQQTSSCHILIGYTGHIIQQLLCIEDIRISTDTSSTLKDFWWVYLLLP